MGEACLTVEYTTASATAASAWLAEEAATPWYALKVRTGSEALIVTALRSRGLTTYCPTQRVERRYSDRKKVMETALFPGYVFCQFDLQKKLPIISTPGVEYIVGFSAGPVPIPEQEIVNIRRLIDAGASPIRSLVSGQRVRVTRGAFEGVEGTLVRDQEGEQLVVSISLLNQGACLRMNEFAVSTVE